MVITALSSCFQVLIKTLETFGLYLMALSTIFIITCTIRFAPFWLADGPTYFGRKYGAQLFFCSHDEVPRWWHRPLWSNDTQLANTRTVELLLRWQYFLFWSSQCVRLRLSDSLSKRFGKIGEGTGKPQNYCNCQGVAAWTFILYNRLFVLFVVNKVQIYNLNVV